MPYFNNFSFSFLKIWYPNCFNVVVTSRNKWFHIQSTSRNLNGWCNAIPMTWWRHQMEIFSALLAFCAGNSPVPVNSPHKGQWRGALMFSLICAWANSWVNNRDAGDLRRHHAHYDVTVMRLLFTCLTFEIIVLFITAFPDSESLAVLAKQTLCVASLRTWHQEQHRPRLNMKIAFLCMGNMKTAFPGIGICIIMIKRLGIPMLVGLFFNMETGPGNILGCSRSPPEYKNIWDIFSHLKQHYQKPYERVFTNVSRQVGHAKWKLW